MDLAILQLMVWMKLLALQTARGARGAVHVLAVLDKTVVCARIARICASSEDQAGKSNVVNSGNVPMLVSRPLKATSPKSIPP